MIVRAIAVSAVIATAGSPAAAAEILCSRAGAADVTISLNSRAAFGRELSCIAGDFVEDTTPCAPDGGYGLSAPTGDARLVGLAMDWREPAYANHTSGGVTQFFSTPAKFYFAGGVMGWPRTGLNESWRFEVSRLTGRGALTLPNRPPAAYACHAERQIF